MCGLTAFGKHREVMTKLVWMPEEALELRRDGG